MITDPKTIPVRPRRAPRLRRRDRRARGAPDRAADDRVRHQGRGARRARARVRGAAAARVPARPPAARRAAGRAGSRSPRPAASALVALASALVLAGIPARPDAEAGVRPGRPRRAHLGLGARVARASRRSTAARRSRSPRTSSRTFGPSPRRCGAAIPTVPPPERTEPGSRRCGPRSGPAAEPRSTVPEYRVESVDVTLEPAEGQSPPTVVATVEGTVELVTYEGSPPAAVARGAPEHFSRTFELSAEGRPLPHRPRPRSSLLPRPRPSASDGGLRRRVARGRGGRGRASTSATARSASACRRKTRRR